MAAIRAGVFNGGFGTFRTNNNHRNSAYRKSIILDPEISEKSESSSEISERANTNRKDEYKKYINILVNIEKNRILTTKKKDKIGRLEKNIKAIDTVIVILSNLGMFLANFEAEDYYNNGRSPTQYSDSYRAIVSISTCFVLFFLVFNSYYDYQIIREKKENFEAEVIPYLSMQNLKFLIIEFILNMIHCPPGLNYNFQFKQMHGTLTLSITEICASFTLLRVFVFFKLLRHYSKWCSKNSQEICENYGAEAKNLFAAKAMLKERPFRLLVPLIGASVFFFSVAVRIYERGFESPNSSLDYSYIWNSMWLVMLTMTTVGYGDFYPRTHIGRFIIVFACLWGIFLISLMVVTLTNSISFTSDELKSFEFMNKVKNLNISKKFAKNYIKIQLERFLIYRKNKEKFKNMDENHNFLGLSRFYFKKFKEYQDYAKFSDDDISEMLKVLNERISIQIRTIEKSIEKAFSLIENVNLALASQEKTKKYLEKSIQRLAKLNNLYYKLI